MKTKKLLLAILFLISMTAVFGQKAGSWTIGAEPETVGVYLQADSATMLIVQKDYVAFNGRAYQLNYSKKVFLSRKHKFLLQDKDRSILMYLQQEQKNSRVYAVLMADEKFGFESSLIYRR